MEILEMITCTFHNTISFVDLVVRYD